MCTSPPTRAARSRDRETASYKGEGFRTVSQHSTTASYTHTTSTMSAPDYRPIITGAPGGLAPNRLELRDFVKDKKGFALYVQALDVIFKEPFDNDFSWPAIGGIHGSPNVRWGDSGPADAPGGDTFGGYCTHGSVLFPTWHRPYVVLFEQSMHNTAKKIAAEYSTDQLGWLKAAEDFRVPYWDWARPLTGKEQAVPEEMISETVTIITPQGAKTVKNPVHSFTFTSKYPYTTFGSPWDAWQTTLRYPTSNAPDAKSQMDLFNTTFSQNSSQIRTQSYQMLTRLLTWNYFSNHTTKQNPPIANSIETIHDTMHLLIGGNIDYEGHMSEIPIAGFDAAFFLHHANVDRMLALWQAIHYDVWVIPGDQPNGTYTIKDNAPVNVQSDLTPFWLTQSTYWNSKDVRDYVGNLHYSYPDFNGLEGKTPAQVSAAILKHVTELYGPTIQPGGPEKLIAGSGSVQPGGPEKPATSSNPGDSASVGYNSTTHEWTVHIRFKKYEFGKSFAVQVYLADTYVGCVSAFATTAGAAQQCENCRNNVDIELEGFVHLNEVILQKLHTLSPDVVKPYLTENLSLGLKTRKPDGTPADISRDLPSLKVAPFSRQVSQDSPYEIPRLGDATYHHDVLAGKPGHTPEDRW